MIKASILSLGIGLITTPLTLYSETQITAPNDVKIGGHVGNRAPTFSAERMDGRLFSLSDFKDKKAILLVFWATWCANCKAEIPAIKALYETYAADIEVLAINVAVNDSLKKVTHYQKKHALNYPVFFDANKTIAKAYGIVGVPTQVIIDSHGIVRYRDAESPKDIADQLSSLLKR